MTNSPRWRVYLDTNFFIRLAEGRDEKLLHVLNLEADGAARLHTSELTLAELLVAPLRDKNHALANQYEATFDGESGLQTVPVDRQILRASAEIRAEIGNKLPDAIHIATAMRQDCNVFFSSDRRLRLPASLVQIPLEGVAREAMWP